MSETDYSGSCSDSDSTKSPILYSGVTNCHKESRSLGIENSLVEFNNVDELLGCSMPQSQLGVAASKVGVPNKQQKSQKSTHGAKLVSLGDTEPLESQVRNIIRKIPQQLSMWFVRVSLMRSSTIISTIIVSNKYNRLTACT